MKREERDQLRGIVAIWLTNGNKPVDAGNETRYEFFSGGYMEAADATDTLAKLGLVLAPEADDAGTIDVSRTVPTAKGIFEAIS